MDREKKYSLMELAIAELIANPHNGVHRAYIGKKGDDEVIVCCVKEKKHKSKLSADEFIPSFMDVEDTETDLDVHQFRTDVEESPEASIQRLDWDPKSWGIQSPSLRSLQNCQSPTIKGGSQIAPQGANWVGTLGCAVKRDGVYGALTNYHVANGGRFGKNALQCQPHGGSSTFGFQIGWITMNFNGGDNFVDCSFIADAREAETGQGIFCIPEQHHIGRIKTEFHREISIQLGLKVQKVGRTTGHTKGTVVGVRSTEHVNYGEEGTAKFVRQTIFRGDDGQNFSAGGDSGSLIVDMENRPVALLFAGGGQDTIGNPIEFVVDKLGIQFF